MLDPANATPKVQAEMPQSEVDKAASIPERARWAKKKRKTLSGKLFLKPTAI